MESINRKLNRLTAKQTYQLNQWLTKNAPALYGKSAEEQEAFASTAVGFKVTRKNIVKAREITGAEVMIPSYERSREAAALRKQPTSDATKVITLARVLARLHVDLGQPVPAEVMAITGGV